MFFKGHKKRKKNRTLPDYCKWVIAKKIQIS